MEIKNEPNDLIPPQEAQIKSQSNEKALMDISQSCASSQSSISFYGKETPLLKKLLRRRFLYTTYFLLIDITITSILFHLTYTEEISHTFNLIQLIIFLFTYVTTFTLLFIKGKKIIKSACILYIVYSISDLCIVIVILFLDSSPNGIFRSLDHTITIICCFTMLIMVRIFTPFMIRGYGQVVNTVFSLKKVEDNEILINRISNAHSGIFDNEEVRE